MGFSLVLADLEERIGHRQVAEVAPDEFQSALALTRIHADGPEAVEIRFDGLAVDLPLQSGFSPDVTDPGRDQAFELEQLDPFRRDSATTEIRKFNCQIEQQLALPKNKIDLSECDPLQFVCLRYSR